VRGWLRQTTGGLPRTFWYLWTGTLINRIGSFVILYLAIYLTRELGYSQSRAGLILGLYGAGGAVGTVIGGVLADRWGRRPTLLNAHVGAATLMLCLGFAGAYWQLAISALLLGMFAESARPAFSAMMVDVVPPADRLRAFSLNYWAINLGFACAAVLAGLAAELDYLLLFAIDAGTTLITASVIFLKVRESHPVRTGRTPAPASGGGLGAVLRDRVFLVFLALNLLGALVMMQHLSTLPIAMSADGLGPATFGWVIAVNGVLIVAGQLFVPRIIERRGRSRVLALANLIMGIGFGLTAFADAAWLYAGTVLIWTLGEMLHSPSNSALMGELAPVALRGRYQGLNSLTWSAAVALAPIVGGFTQEHLGNTTLWLGCTGVGALVAVGQLLSGPARERRAVAVRRTGAVVVAAPIRPPLIRAPPIRPAPVWPWPVPPWPGPVGDPYRCGRRGPPVR
jgi:MFS family permease